MILTCPACQTRYQADASKFPPQGRDVRCARCGHTWHQLPPEPEPAEEIPVAPPPEPEPPPPPSYAPEPSAPEPEAYVQPPVRDVEPHEDAQEAEPPQPGPLRTHKVFLGIGWIGLAAAVLLIVGGAAFFREQIVQAWPRSASLYTTLGMKIPASGLQIRDLAWNEAMENDQIVGTVTGQLANTTNRDMSVPPLRVGLLDGKKQEIYHWTFSPDTMTLRPGQTMRFETRLSSPPAGARDFEVRFAKAGE